MLPVFSVTKLIGVIVILIGVAMVLAGCANQAAQLHPQLVGADAAVNSGGILFRNGGLSVLSAHKLSVDAHAASKAFHGALTAIQANQSPADVTATEILTALSAIAEDLQTTPQAKALAARIRAKVAAGKKTLTPSEVISLIDLVVQVTPEVIAELNTLFSGSPITAADCAAALDKLDADLAAFDGLINSH